jgi:hypothetical protein
MTSTPLQFAGVMALGLRWVCRVPAIVLPLACGAGPTGAFPDPPDADAGGSAGQDASPIPLPDAGVCSPKPVASPPEGIPAEITEICAQPDDPVDSNRAVRFTLEPAAGGGLTGRITFAMNIREHVAGQPAVEAVDDNEQGLWDLVIGPMTKTADGFDFSANAPSPETSPNRAGSLRVRTTFEVTCEDAGAGSARLVRSATELNICGEWSAGGCSCASEKLRWVSSGDQCVNCTIILD